MQYESTAQALQAMARLQQTLFAYNHATGVLYLDAVSYTHLTLPTILLV